MSAQPPASGDPFDPSRPVGESSISDEEWERFQRESEGAARLAAPAEPSARARMVTERLRRQDEERAARSRGRRNGPAQPDGWRTGPPTFAAEDRARRRRRWVTGVLAAAVVLVAGLTVAGELPGLPGGDPASRAGGPAGAEAGDGAVLPAETARPTRAPAVGGTVRPTRERPFAGSPAERWDSGADAIVLPSAKAVNGVSAARVAKGEALLKEFLVASNLDPKVLNGADPVKVLALLDPLQGVYVTDLKEGLRKPSADSDPKWTVTRFDSDEVGIIGHDIRVRGRMTVRRGDPGAAILTADYTFVYPLVSKNGRGEMTRTVVRRVVEAQVVDPVRWESTDGRIWIRDTKASFGNDACESTDGLVHPRFGSEPGAEPSPGATKSDPYDRSRSLSSEFGGACDVATRI
ncbi:hypothetical protein [Streptomyces lushanensis]|uniref:hypothetical protein n=1 Tax=Streptomyces lushanensis TaxID=1434255 RepID=UPI0008363602|nr:hypothetical protein [Streptomyces lushanensis]